MHHLAQGVEENRVVVAQGHAQRRDAGVLRCGGGRGSSSVGAAAGPRLGTRNSSVVPVPASLRMDHHPPAVSVLARISMMPKWSCTRSKSSIGRCRRPRRVAASGVGSRSSRFSNEPATPQVPTKSSRLESASTRPCRSDPGGCSRKGQVLPPLPRRARCAAPRGVLARSATDTREGRRIPWNLWPSPRLDRVDRPSPARHPRRPAPPTMLP